MAIPGFRVSLRRSGTPTASTGNQFNATTVANEYQIASTAKRVLDRTVAPSGLKSSTGGAISSTDISDVDYLFGKITFNTTHTSSVDADVTHLPMSDIGGANEFTLSMTNNLLEDTDFTSTGIRTRTIGLKDVTMSITRFLPSSTATEFFDKWLETTGTTTFLVEVNTQTTGPLARGFFKLASDNRAGSVDELETESLELSLDASTAASISSRVGFGWSDA